MGNEFWNKLRTATTYGQVLPDGRAIDLVASTADEKLEIIAYDGEQPLIVPQLEHDGVVYVPPVLHSSIRRAMFFPTAASEYGNATSLLSKVIQLCIRYFGLSETFATIGAVWALSGWVPELFEAPPTLCIAGCSMAQATRFFRFVTRLCRRAITVAALSQHLPLQVRPTLLLVEAGLSKKVRASWRACSYRGVHLPVSGGALQERVCSKAIYSETGDATGWGDEALSIVLLPPKDLPSLTESDLEAIAAEFQPQFELYRLRRLRTRSTLVNDRYPAELAGSGLSRELFHVLADEPGMTKLLLPVAEQQRQTMRTRRSVDPLAVIIEVIWAPTHEQKIITTSEVCQRVNALLRARGEKLEYTVREIGWKLSDLGLRRNRTAKGTVLRFSRELREQIHGLATRFELPLPKVDPCPNCSSVQVVEQ